MFLCGFFCFVLFCFVFWWPGKNCYSFSGKLWFICHIHQTLEFRISIYFGLYKIPLMKEISIPWKAVEHTWNSSLLKKKKKSFGKMKLWSFLNKWQKIVEHNSCSIMFWWKWNFLFYIYLKTKGNWRKLLANTIVRSVSSRCILIRFN